MSVLSIAEGRISGRYQHYKNKCYYNVICAVYDKFGEKYVLYQQDYGNKSLWIRPFDMFFEEVIDPDTSKRVPRFARESEPRDLQMALQELIALVESQSVCIKHSELEEFFVITHIDTKKECVLVHSSDGRLTSGYLTEFELMKRLGYVTCRIDDEIRFFEIRKSIDEYFKLCIGDNDIDKLKRLINPCSIDLQIAETGFLRTTRRTVDLQSIEHLSNPTILWKPIRKHYSKKHGRSYIKLNPGMVVLTHTKERIVIPHDCAGKIEIKSTFARLSLSLTASDFCNPGYDGYFPLEIKNNGKHTMRIYEGETMAQLMLIPLMGPILDAYADKATYKNEKGFDDGMPYSFWKERSIKALRKRNGTQEIIDIYREVLQEISTTNTKDVNAFRERFSNTFLTFCDKRLGCQKFRDHNLDQPNAKKLLTAFISMEKTLKIIFDFKWASFGGGLLLAVLPPLLENVFVLTASLGAIVWLVYGLIIAFAGLLLVLSIILFIKRPTAFCTFEGIDIKSLWEER